MAMLNNQRVDFLGAFGFKTTKDTTRRARGPELLWGTGLDVSVPTHGLRMSQLLLVFG